MISIDMTVIALLLAGYWCLVIALGARSLRTRQAVRAIQLASPLIELELESDLQARLSEVASDQKQKMAVVAFDLLDREIPRFEQEETEVVLVVTTSIYASSRSGRLSLQ